MLALCLMLLVTYYALNYASIIGLGLCIAKCEELVIKKIPCGHSTKAKVHCYKPIYSIQCNEPCTEVLSCGHQCSGDCHSCFRGRFHKMCQHLYNPVAIMTIRFIALNPMHNHHVLNLVIIFVSMEKDVQINVVNYALYVWNNVSGSVNTISVARNAMKFVIILIAINHVQIIEVSASM